MTSWVLVFVITVHGQPHSNMLHGYDSQGACERDARAFDRAFDLVRYRCQPEESKSLSRRNH